MIYAQKVRKHIYFSKYSIYLNIFHHLSNHAIVFAHNNSISHSNRESKVIYCDLYILLYIIDVHFFFFSLILLFYRDYNLFIKNMFKFYRS